MTTQISNDSEKIASQLHSLAIHLLRKLRREDEGGQLNAPRLSALSVIVFAGPITLGDLAAAEQVRPPTMSRIVNALEGRGLITKKKDTSDGRSTYLSATRTGKTLLMEGRARRVRALATQISVLNPEKSQVLREAAEILQYVVESI